MAYFTADQIARIPLPSNPEYWVDIVGDLTWGQIKKIGKAGSDVQEGGELDFETTGDTFLLLAIKAWNLDDESGNVLEITSENIDRLHKDDAMAIIAAASGVVVDDDDTKKNSSKTSKATTPESQ